MSITASAELLSVLPDGIEHNITIEISLHYASSQVEQRLKLICYVKVYLCVCLLLQLIRLALVGGLCSLAFTARAEKPGKTPPASVVSFRNHVLPILTKNGCNSGACHGAAAGKGGLKLSLRGFDPDADYAVLTRQAWGRRVVAGEPERSLLLLKPSMQIGHGGGERIKRNSPDYKIVADWIAGGTRPPRPDDVKLLALDVVAICRHAASGRQAAN